MKPSRPHRSPKGAAAALVSFLLAACLAPAFAGGPLIVVGGGEFLKWRPGEPVPYRVDPGPLSATRNNAEGTQLVRDAFARWEAIPTAVLSTNEVGQLPMDVNPTNFGPFLNQPQPNVSIIFDADGEIIETALGDGSSDTTLGFAGPTFADQEGFFTTGFIVLNGLFAGSSTFNHAVAHELGHLLGLDHTQANRRFEFEPGMLRQFVPLMYPFALNGQTDGPVLDDEVWFSFLYPAPQFGQNEGRIEGRALRRSGLPMQGTHVTAFRVTSNQNGQLEFSDSDVVGTVSDFLLTGDGSYILPGLPPGDWVVFIEPVDFRFSGGSGVGPFEPRFRFFDFPQDFFNGAQESADENELESLVIPVAAGETVVGIDIVSNNPPRDIGDGAQVPLGDDDAQRFEFPEGFSFPFAGRAFGTMMVHSDGNITFLEPEASSTSRSATRLESGPPRIAPFFTDLDPSQRGTVRVVSPGPGEVRVEWEDVPEFTTQPGPQVPGNTFSVTLKSNGEIVFDYTEIGATADFDGIQGVAGLSAGYLGSEDANQMDLSQAAGPIAYSDQGGVLEQFAGNSADLAERQIVFQPSQDRDFVFPINISGSDRFTGFAAANVDGGDAVVVLESREADGSVSGFPDNPTPQPLLDRDQFAKIGAELFGFNLGSTQQSWVRMTSSQPGLASFFQFGNGLSDGMITQLDGGIAIPEEQLASRIFFSRVLQGPSVQLTPGGFVQAETTFVLINPSDETVDVEATYFQATGAQAFGTAMRSIPPFGQIVETFGSLFDTTDAIMDGHVEVNAVGGPGVMGFQFINLPDSVFGLNAFQQGTSNTIFSAQLANGGTMGFFTFTNLKIVNTSDQLLEVTVFAIDRDGTTISQSPVLTFNPNQSLQRDAGDLFGLGLPSTATQTTGSIIVQADGPGLVGDVIFGDPVDFQNAASLQLQSQTFSRAFFSQVATNAIIFTGLAFFNPSQDQDAQVTIRVFNPRGGLVGEAALPLMAGNRTSKTIAELVPAAATQVGGYIEVSSTVPIVAQELFGTNDLAFLSAVPPQAEQP